MITRSGKQLRGPRLNLALTVRRPLSGAVPDLSRPPAERRSDNLETGAGFSWSNQALLDYPSDGRHAAPTVFVSEPSFLDSAPDLSELLVRHGYLEEDEVNAFYASL